MSRALFWALFAVFLAYIVSLRSVWLWVVFATDYCLGNPGPFGAYRDKLFEEEFQAYPVKGYVKPSAILELDASNYSFEAFKLLTDDWTKPVIIKGLFKDAPLMSWTPDTLIEHYKNSNRTFMYVENNRMGSTSDGFFVYDANWAPLDQIVANISGGGANYIHNSNFYYPDDLPLYRQLGLERSKFDRKTLLIQFFIGKVLPGEQRLGGSPLHCAAAPNLFIQISGAKKWIMIDPKYSRYIKPKHFSNQFAAYAEAGVYNEGNDTNQRWGRYPRSEGIVRRGDALWVPGWVWHEVHNVPSDEWNMAIATRYSVLPSLWKNNWLFTILTDFGTKGKKCPPGLRYVCATFYTYEGGVVVQRFSEAGNEIDKLISKEKLEKDFE